MLEVSSVEFGRNKDTFSGRVGVLFFTYTVYSDERASICIKLYISMIAL